MSSVVFLEQDHPRGAGGRFVPVHHVEPAAGLLGGPVSVMDADGAYVDVVPGQRSPAASHVYLRGQCLAMAFAVSERTGWPVLMRTASLGPDEPPLLLHACVQAPDGTLVDYLGGTHPEEAADNWDEEDDFELVPADRAAELLAAYDGYLAQQNTTLAASFVDGVLDLYEDSV